MRSARSITDCGIARPIAFAVLMFNLGHALIAAVEIALVHRITSSKMYRYRYTY